MACALSSGGRLPLHFHRESGETFRFYDSAEFVLGGKIISPSYGQEIYVPAGAAHGSLPASKSFIRAVACKPNLVEGDFFLARP